MNIGRSSEALESKIKTEIEEEINRIKDKKEGRDLKEIFAAAFEKTLHRFKLENGSLLNVGHLFTQLCSVYNRDDAANITRDTLISGFVNASVTFRELNQAYNRDDAVSILKSLAGATIKGGGVLHASNLFEQLCEVYNRDDAVSCTKSIVKAGVNSSLDFKSVSKRFENDAVEQTKEICKVGTVNLTLEFNEMNKRFDRDDSVQNIKSIVRTIQDGNIRRIEKGREILESMVEEEILDQKKRKERGEKIEEKSLEEVSRETFKKVLTVCKLGSVGMVNIPNLFNQLHEVYNRNDALGCCEEICESGPVNATTEYEDLRTAFNRDDAVGAIKGITSRIAWKKELIDKIKEVYVDVLDKRLEGLEILPDELKNSSNEPKN